MERIICDQIRGHLSKHHLLCDTQYAFREKRSTVDMLSYITQWWNNALDTQQEIRVVWRNSSFGIQGDLRCWIASFLSDRQQYVVLNGSTSSAKPICAGAPRGVSLVLYFFWYSSMTWLHTQRTTSTYLLMILHSILPLLRICAI